LEELSKMIDLLSEVGIPFAVTAGLVYIAFKVGLTLPKCLEEYFADAKKRNEKYDDQMRIITVVAQQGVEAQRRGNEIIERNNIIMSARTQADEQLILNLKALADQINRIEDVTLENRKTVQNIFYETVKMSKN